MKVSLPEMQRDHHAWYIAFFFLLLAPDQQAMYVRFETTDKEWNAAPLERNYHGGTNQQQLFQRHRSAHEQVMLHLVLVKGGREVREYKDKPSLDPFSRYDLSCQGGWCQRNQLITRHATTWYDHEHNPAKRYLVNASQEASQGILVYSFTRYIDIPAGTQSRLCWCSFFTTATTTPLNTATLSTMDQGSSNYSFNSYTAQSYQKQPHWHIDTSVQIEIV